MPNSEDHPLRDVLPLAEGFGRGLRKIRLENQLTLDKVASTATVFGLKWSTARVVEFEKGRIPITLPTLMRLGTTLTALTGRPVTLSELLDWDHWLELPGEGVIHSQAFRQAFSGGGVDLRQGDELENERDDTIDASTVMADVPPGITVRQLKYMHEYSGLADERAARKLGMSHDEFLAFAYAVLGTSLAERTHGIRYEDGATVSDSPQRRGHTTRKLSGQIEQFARRYKDGDPLFVSIMARLHTLWGDASDAEKANWRADVERALAEIEGSEHG